MKATAQLREEHSGVLTMLKVLDAITARIGSGPGSSMVDLEKTLDFLKGFVDTCHHAKEEELLFPALREASGDSELSTVETLLNDHRKSRERVRMMTELLEHLRAGKLEAAAELKKAARSYIDLLTDHIDLENGTLFPFAERILDDEEQERIYEDFEVLERERVGVGRHTAYHALMDTLMHGYGIA
jgi:hemerythrin-like domain-containing protein